MNLYPKMLVAIDLNEYGEKTLKQAKFLASQLGSILYLLHVVEPLPVITYSFMIGIVNVEQDMIKEATQKIRKRGEQYEIAENQQYVELGVPKNIILEKAKTLEIDLIIIGSHSKKGFDRLLGSTAAAVVNGADRDVTVIYINK